MYIYIYIGSDCSLLTTGITGICTSLAIRFHGFHLFCSLSNRQVILSADVPVSVSAKSSYALVYPEKDRNGKSY